MFPFKTALNASTLLPFKLDVKQQMRVAAGAGFDGIELWVRDIEAYREAGGTLGDVKAYAAESGITIVNAIAFFPWADADATIRQRGFAQAEREMRMLAEMGCRAVAAPPFGNVEGVTLEAMAEYFAQLTDIAQGIGIELYLEFWGRAKRLSRLSEALFVLMESGVADGTILLDPYHMYTGGSTLNSLRYVNGANIGIVHVNDYPAVPSREQIADRDRVFPGEGIAPTHEFAMLLNRAGYRGYLSLELFIESYGAEPAEEVARRGLDMIKNAYSVEA